MQHIAVTTPKFIKKKLKENCLFLKEKYLSSLPEDYIDCVMFIFSNGVDQTEGARCIILDDKQSSKLIDLLGKHTIEVFILSERIKEGKKIMWQVGLMREAPKDNKDPGKLFFGGENLREYCDLNNVFYKSALTKDKKLISVTNLMYQKNENEDCRIPSGEFLHD